MGTNVSTTFIQCPADAKKKLGIKLPFLVMKEIGCEGAAHENFVQIKTNIQYKHV